MNQIIKYIFKEKCPKTKFVIIFLKLFVKCSLKRSDQIFTQNRDSGFDF